MIYMLDHDRSSKLSRVAAFDPIQLIDNRHTLHIDELWTSVQSLKFTYVSCPSENLLFLYARRNFDNRWR